jgi:hypothetical protein
MSDAVLDRSDDDEPFGLDGVRAAIAEMAGRHAVSSLGAVRARSRHSAVTRDSRYPWMRACRADGPSALAWDDQRE